MLLAYELIRNRDVGLHACKSRLPPTLYIAFPPTVIWYLPLDESSLLWSRGTSRAALPFAAAHLKEWGVATLYDTTYHHPLDVLHHPHDGDRETFFWRYIYIDAQECPLRMLFQSPTSSHPALILLLTYIRYRYMYQIKCMAVTRCSLINRISLLKAQLFHSIKLFRFCFNFFCTSERERDNLLI